MAEGSILTDDFLRELMNVGEVDILIGVPTYNDGQTVASVVQAIRSGLLKYYPRQRSVIINADGGSTDGTQDLVRAASISDLRHISNLNALRTLHCVSTLYGGGAASGSALHTILAAAELLRANQCAVISPVSTSIEPEWIEKLLLPVSQGKADLVTPIYRRHKFDGLLVRNLGYPMTRALYCRRVREPHPSEFAFSARLATHFLERDMWSQEVCRIGAETCLTLDAITSGFQLSQCFLGSRSNVDYAPHDLVLAMRQTVGVLFWSLDQNIPACVAGQGSEAVLTFGVEYETSLEPRRINRKRLHQMFVHGVAELEPVLDSILAPATLAELRSSAALPEDHFRYSDELWVRTVYEFAAAYHNAVISRDHVLQALAPLYRGKAYTFLVENRDYSGEQVEQNVEQLCLTFERLRPYLLEVWAGRK